MYSHILVPIDGSATSAKGLDEAIALARHLKSRLRLVHVVQLAGMVTPESLPLATDQTADAIRSAGNKLLQECKDKATKAGVEAEVDLVETTASTAGECIVATATASQADLIVCGTHGREGISRVLMGSDAEYVARHAAVPVLLVRHQEES
jgi:nucleotide-binding universal stress UspA family protein